MPDLTLVIASANVDKAAEIADILGTVPGLALVPRPAHVPDVEETGDTLEANARLKARALCEATGHAAVADDTGLEVEALEGPIDIADCADVPSCCIDPSACALKDVFDEANSTLRGFFDAISLAELVERQRAKEGSGAGMYFI